MGTVGGGSVPTRLGGREGHGENAFLWTPLSLVGFWHPLMTSSVALSPRGKPCSPLRTAPLNLLGGRCRLKSNLGAEGIGG